MPTDIVMPEAGESVTTGVIASWLKQDGDWVDRDETVVEVETDKITVEVPAPAAGVVKASVAEGDEIEVGQVLGTIDESAEKPEEVGASASKESKAQKAEGAGQEQSEASDESDRSGGSGKADTSDKPKKSEKSEPGDSDARDKAASEPSKENGEARATPLARKLAQEHGIDLSKIKGTGVSRRIREQDVIAFIESDSKSDGKAQADTQAAPERSPGPSAPDADREVTHEKLSPLRQRIAARLVEAQHTAAMLTTFNECDMTRVMALRKRHKEAFAEKHGVGLGFMSFFVKAIVAGLRAFPDVNSFIVEKDGSLVVQRHSYCDVAVAVSSPKGLVVPVLRDCQNLSFADIESGVKDLATKARDGKLTLEEMQGGTFTITNGGVFGSLNSTPILNPPQSGILGMHAIKGRPVEDPDNPGQVAIRPMMYLALSYDHRMIDGATAVQFLVAIKDRIEDPERLLLEV